MLFHQPKKKKSSSVERVKPQEKKETKPKKKTKKREPILPINVRQFLNPNQDRTGQPEAFLPFLAPILAVH